LRFSLAKRKAVETALGESEARGVGKRKRKKMRLSQKIAYGSKRRGRREILHEDLEFGFELGPALA